MSLSPCQEMKVQKCNFFSTIEFKCNKFKLASTFNPPRPPALETFITLNEFDLNNRLNFRHSDIDNLTAGERKALLKVRKMDDIIIKQANKGKLVVVQSKQQYLEESYRQRSDTKFYKPLEQGLTET